MSPQLKRTGDETQQEGGIVKLQDLGWTEDWQHKFEPYRGATLAPGRVLAEHKNSYRVATESVELAAEVAGRLRYESFRRSDFPAVGDFVALRLPPGQGPAIVHGILPRKTVFARKVAGERSEEQVIAANLDVIFIVTALDRDFNLRRLERYLTQVWEGGAQPVVLLNKSDVCEDVDKVIATFDPIAFGVPSHVISALAGEGLERLEPYLASGSTVGFVGSSGVGKSTLLNRLLGSEAQA